MIALSNCLRIFCVAGWGMLLPVAGCEVPEYKLWPLDTGGTKTDLRSGVSGGSSSNFSSSGSANSPLLTGGTYSVASSSFTLATGGTSFAQSTLDATLMGGNAASGGAVTIGGAAIGSFTTLSTTSTAPSGGTSAGGAPNANITTELLNGGTSTLSGGTCAGGTSDTTVTTELHSGGTSPIGGGTSAGGVPSTSVTTELHSGGVSSLGGSTCAGGTSDTTVTTELHSGGTLSVSGGASAGGQSASSGAPSTTGGISGTGTGGASNANAYCQSFTDLGTLQGKSNVSMYLPVEATCYRFSVSDLMNQVQGIGMYECDTRKGLLNGVDCTSGCAASLPIERAADGYWYVDFGPGKSSNCKAQWWWY